MLAWLENLPPTPKNFLLTLPPPLVDDLAAYISKEINRLNEDDEGYVRFDFLSAPPSPPNFSARFY